MYRKIIVGYKDSDESRDALALGKLIAEATGGELVVTGVFPYGPEEPFASATMRRQFDEAETERALEIERVAKAAGAKAEAFPSTSPARGLHDAIEELGADLLVVGSSSRAGAGRALAGNVALQLLHGASCAVAVAPKGFADVDRALRVIGVGVDGSEASREAVRAAVELCQASKASIRLFTAVDASRANDFGWGYGQLNWKPVLLEAMEEKLEEVAREVPDELRPEKRLIDGEIASSLVAEAQKGVDLLVLGSRGYGPLRRVLLGSVSGALVKSAPCPVLVIPRGVHTSEEAGVEAALSRGAE